MLGEFASRVASAADIDMRSEKCSTGSLQVYVEQYIVAKPLKIGNIGSFREEPGAVGTRVVLIGAQYT